MSYKIGAWNVRTLLTGGALKLFIKQLLNYKGNSHTKDWMGK
jgi:hypothetical protein